MKITSKFHIEYADEHKDPEEWIKKSLEGVVKYAISNIDIPQFTCIYGVDNRGITEISIYPNKKLIVLGRRFNYNSYTFDSFDEIKRLLPYEASKLLDEFLKSSSKKQSDDFEKDDIPDSIFEFIDYKIDSAGADGDYDPDDSGSFDEWIDFNIDSLAYQALDKFESSYPNIFSEYDKDELIQIFVSYIRKGEK